MPSGSRYALLVLLTLAATGLVLPSAVADAPAVSAGGSPTAAPAVDGPASTSVATGSPGQIDGGELYQTGSQIDVQLQPDGDARFEVNYRYNLTDEPDRAAFQETASAFENGEITDLGLSSFRRAQSEASRTTDRSMEIRSPRRSSSIVTDSGNNATGQLTLSFVWTNFARTNSEDGTLEVDDVFQTPSGTWLPRLEPGQQFVIRPPEGYGPVTGSGDLREGSFYWGGAETFTAESAPSAVFSGDRLPMTVVVALLFGGVVSVLGLGYLAVRRRDVLGDGGDSGSAPAAATDQSGPDDDTGAPGGGTDGVADNGTAAAAASDDAGDDGVDVELLSDEERVERLLDQNGGRMKQASIVKETGWSNAKVSQLLSSMADEDRIDKLRIGRENLISFPDEDVADVEE